MTFALIISSLYSVGSRKEPTIHQEVSGSCWLRRFAAFPLYRAKFCRATIFYDVAAVKISGVTRNTNYFRSWLGGSKVVDKQVLHISDTIEASMNYKPKKYLMNVPCSMQFFVILDRTKKSC